MYSRTTLALALATTAGCNGSIDALYAAGKDVPPTMGTTTDTSGGGESAGDASGDATGATVTGATAGDVTSDGADPTSTGADPTSDSSTDSGDSGDSGDTTDGAPIAPPKIWIFDVPPKVTTAGPMHVYVYAEHAKTAEVRLNDEQTFYLKNEGDVDGDGVDVFSGVIPIYGTPDNGKHSLMATVRRKDLEDSLGRHFDVATPPAGSLAWEKYGGAGSNTARLVATPDGYVYEAGSFEINGLARPAIRLRDPVTGVDVWQEGARVLDAREGSIAAVSLAPDGRVWVALNVREGNTWIARIASFTADMEPTGAELVKPGATVNGIASDSAGGCFAVGFAVTVFGDTDVLV